MEQNDKPWLRYLRKQALIAAVQGILGWPVFVYGLGNSYEESGIMVMALVLIGPAVDSVFWLMRRLWARWWAWISAG